MYTINSEQYPFRVSCRFSEKRHNDCIEYREPVWSPANEIHGSDENSVNDNSTDWNCRTREDTLMGIQFVDEFKVEVDDQDERNHIPKDEGSKNKHNIYFHPPSEKLTSK